MQIRQLTTGFTDFTEKSTDYNTRHELSVPALLCVFA